MALIILAHPNYETSFANKTIIDELQKSNLDLEIRNIHNLYPDYQIDVKVEQEALLRHQNIVFQFPLHWYNVPAILKHYYDEVFAYQFSHGPEGDKVKGKNFILSFTAGTPEDSYSKTGYQRFEMQEYFRNLEQLAHYAQMTYIDPISIYAASLFVGTTQEELTIKSKDHASRLLKKISELEN